MSRSQIAGFLFLLSSYTALAYGQEQPPPPDSSADQAQQRNESQRAAEEVKPGEEVIKNKDLWEKTGYFHPFRRMPRYILQDQKAIWTSPFHTAKSDIKWW